jgi:hypothetical protein
MCCSPVAGTAEQDKIAAEEQISRYLEESTENGDRISFRAGGGTLCLVRGRSVTETHLENASILPSRGAAGTANNGRLCRFSMKSLHEIEKDLFFLGSRKFNALLESRCGQGLFSYHGSTEDGKTIELLGSALVSLLLERKRLGRLPCFIISDFFFFRCRTE